MRCSRLVCDMDFSGHMYKHFLGSERRLELQVKPSIAIYYIVKSSFRIKKICNTLLLKTIDIIYR